jgi:hypothetical protein
MSTGDAGAGGSGIVIIDENAGSVNAGGVWNMDDLYTYVKAGTWV